MKRLLRARNATGSNYRRFRGDSRAAAAVEFAMVAAPFLGLVAAMFETSLVFFVDQSLSAAVEQAARTILTGRAQSDAAIKSAQQFRDAMICNPSAPMKRVLPSFVDCSKIIVDVRPAASFARADLSNDFYGDMTGAYCTGGPGDIVIVRAAYPMPVYFSIIQATPHGLSVNRAGQTQYNGGWTHMIMGTAAFRSEPFDDSPAAAPGC